jgi:hypothetical protein
VILAAFRDRYASRGFDRADANNLADTIERWLTDHICRIDVELRQSVPLEPDPSGGPRA